MMGIHTLIKLRNCKHMHMVRLSRGLGMVMSLSL